MVFLWSKDRKIELMVKKIELLSSIFFCKDRGIEERRSTGAIRSFGKKSGKIVKRIQKIHLFEQITRFLRAIWSFWSFSKIDESDLIFFKDRWEWFDLFDLFQRRAGAIWSRSIFLKDQWEQFARGRSF